MFLNSKKSDIENKLSLANEKLIRNEKILIQAYKSLKQKEEKLKVLNEELCASEEELQATNEELNSINDELHLKNELINSQNIELKSAFVNLKETQSQLLQAEKMASLGVLTAGVAHEINNPLNFINGAYLGFKKYFNDSSLIDNEDISILLKALKEGIDRAVAIVQGLNQFSRNNQDNNESCNLHSIIDNCLVMMNNQLKHRVEVNKEYFEDDLIILGNIGKLHQVFINIISNSLQAISCNGLINIKTEYANNLAIVEISDNGVGIEKDNLSKITDPFFTTKEPGKGTGLGLAITYNIIKEHKGHIEFISTLGKGTTVKIVFPLNVNYASDSND